MTTNVRSWSTAELGLADVFAAFSAKTVARVQGGVLVGSDCHQGSEASYTASFSSLAGRNATFLLALILMAAPVAGLRPIRAARLRIWSMPIPFSRTLSPFLRWR